jgi:heat-inducible transcriptional repressor
VPGTPMDERIDERKGEILRAIVEEYIESAQPVGSKTIAGSRGLGVSPATIRNEMGALERDGYIVQPHTSAGRVPTDLGYRYYVDHFADPAVLAPSQRREVAAFFTSAARAMEDLLSETSQLLVRLTAHASVVIPPAADVEQVRSVQLVQLQPAEVLLVLVLSDGAIRREVVRLDHDVAEADVAAATARLHDAWSGATVMALPAVAQSGRPGDAVSEILTAAADALARRVGEDDADVYVGGVHRLAAEMQSFESAQTAARLLELLEQHVVFTGLMRDLLGPGLTIRIGAENEHDDLRECSLVLAPYLVEGEPAGTIGVLGPTRMDYRRATAAVEAVSRQLGRQLSR